MKARRIDLDAPAALAGAPRQVAPAPTERIDASLGGPDLPPPSELTRETPVVNAAPRDKLRVADRVARLRQRSESGLRTVGQGLVWRLRSAARSLFQAVDQAPFSGKTIIQPLVYEALRAPRAADKRALLTKAIRGIQKIMPSNLLHVAVAAFNLGYLPHNGVLGAVAGAFQAAYGLTYMAATARQLALVGQLQRVRQRTSTKTRTVGAAHRRLLNPVRTKTEKQVSRGVVIGAFVVFWTTTWLSVTNPWGR